MIYTWSNNDYTQITAEMQIKGIKQDIRFSFMLNNWKDFQKELCQKLKFKHDIALDKIVCAAGLSFEGSQHSASWDARNTAKLYVISQKKETDFGKIRATLEAFYPKKSLMDTDLIEAECLIRELAQTAMKQYPALFKGTAPQVFYKLRYVPPYEEFQELRRLIIELQKAAGFQSKYQGMVCIDASEWREHEQEEYFIVVLKYLYDNIGKSSIVFVCCQYSERDLKHLRNICNQYFITEIDSIHICQLPTT